MANAFDFEHLDDPVFQFPSRGIDTMHAYEFTNVEDALNDNTLWNQISTLGGKIQPVNSQASLNALERIRQLANPTGNLHGSTRHG